LGVTRPACRGKPGFRIENRTAERMVKLPRSQAVWMRRKGVVRSQRG
jgi:hypothetical protein